MKISDDVLQSIKDTNDIVDVVSQKVRLKKSGKNYFGLCPFHHEDTPSFSVSPEKQIYKCFGCGEAGNVITFIMKTRNLPYYDAVKILADRANIELDTEENGSFQYNNKKNELYSVNVEAAKFFFENLRKNKTALNYLLKRGITTKTITNFGLGYALDSWDGLLRHLKAKKFTELDMLNAGLVLKSDRGKIYDRFRNRIVFPVFNYNGKVIGFGGRVLDDSKPKYLNSPETFVFKKGTNLYGLNFALKKGNIDSFIIVEGYMDCISLHQYEIYNAVASLGTALTVNQAKLLKRYTNKIIISYDADAAGQTATIRGLEILKNQGFEVNVLVVPKGKDPDEFIRNNGKEAFLALLQKALPFVDYRLMKAEEGLDLKKREDMLTYFAEISELINNLNPVEKEIYIRKLSDKTGITEHAIIELLDSSFQKNVNNEDNLNNIGNYGQKLYMEPAFVKAERYMLRLMLESKKAFDYINANFTYDDFIILSHKKIGSIIKENIPKGFSKCKQTIEFECVQPDEVKEWIHLSTMEIADIDDSIISLIDDLIKEIRRYKLEEKRKLTMEEIKKLETQGKLNESVVLVEKLMEIQKEIERL